MDDELKALQEYYAVELSRYGNDPASLRVVATVGLLKAARLLWPEAARCGAFSFFETILEATYEDDRRQTDDGDEKKRGTVLNAHEQGLRVFCGGAYALLMTLSAARPDKMSGTKARRLVAEWTGGDISPEVVRKYALDVGAVSTLGPKAKALEAESGFIAVSRQRFEAMIETATVNDLRGHVRQAAAKARSVRAGVEAMKRRSGLAR